MQIPTVPLPPPLHLAFRADSEEVVDLLLERGVNPDPVRVDGVSPLHLAVIGNNLNIARKLLDRGVWCYEEGVRVMCV